MEAHDYLSKVAVSLWQVLGISACLTLWDNLVVSLKGLEIWHIPLILVLKRQRQMDSCKFEFSLVYIASYRSAEGVHSETHSQ